MINILYEDNHVIVVEKPFNMPVQADSSKDLDLLSQVKSYLKEKYHKPGNVYLGLVHRLDRPVGGILVLAKTSKAASRLSMAIRDHNFQKIYLAIVHGNVKDKDTLVDKIAKDEKTHSSYIDEEKGKESILEYTKIAYNKEEDLSLIRINLLTGRHHQIRLQMANQGYPLYGDERYGINDKSQIALYAYKLTFPHPITKENLTFILMPPLKDKWTLFTSFLAQLKGNANII